jgi:hypothetical protein
MSENPIGLKQFAEFIGNVSRAAVRSAASLDQLSQQRPSKPRLALSQRSIECRLMTERS